jgi:hypothetical protein
LAPLLAAAAALGPEAAWAQSPGREPVAAPAEAATQTEPAPLESRAGAGGSELDELRLELARQRAELEAQRRTLQALEQERAVEAAGAEVALATLGGESQAQLAEPERLRVYGFLDAGFQKYWFSDKSGINNVIESRANTFVLGNVNFYFDARPVNHWRALTEVRFTTYPAGQFEPAQFGSGFQRESTRIFDVNSASGGFAQANWGAIILERAQIEWSGMDGFGVRAGYWFTPYGIWNVDHGTPTLISLSVPQFVVNEVFPARQLGVDFYGTLQLAAWTLEYHAYVSNGRTPTQMDLTDDKTVGGRVALGRTAPFPFTLGASSFYGRYSDQQVRMVSALPIEYTRDEVVAYDEVGVSADVSVDAGKVRVRSEFALNRQIYDEGKRAPGWYPGAYFPDRVFWGTYALVAYRSDFAGLEPYIYGELDGNMIPTSQGIVTPSAGLNWHFSPAAQLKLQYSYTRQFNFDDTGRDLSEEDLQFFASRLVVAF